MCYVDKCYYKNIYNGKIEINDIDKSLKNASRDIDTLTFNRIVDIGFDNLTNFQKEIIKEVICEFADFKFENKELINSVLSNYSINGVSMGFNNNSWNIKIFKGIAIPKDLYNRLEQTGLTCRSFNY